MACPIGLGGTAICAGVRIECRSCTQPGVVADDPVCHGLCRAQPAPARLAAKRYVIPKERRMIDQAAFLGDRVVDVSWDQDTNTWHFRASAFKISVACPWRLHDDRKIIIASGDHGQTYGLPNPIDVPTRVREILRATNIRGITVDGVTSDITFIFDNEIRFQTFRETTGYEAWHLTTKSGREYISVGPGTIHQVDTKGYNQAL